MVLRFVIGSTLWLDRVSSRRVRPIRGVGRVTKVQRPFT